MLNASSEVELTDECAQVYLSDFGLSSHLKHLLQEKNWDYLQDSSNILRNSRLSA